MDAFAEYNDVKEFLPEANSFCRVKTQPWLPHYDGAIYKYVTYSDGGYFWDNGDEILQDCEVTHWSKD